MRVSILKAVFASSAFNLAISLSVVAASSCAYNGALRLDHCFSIELLSKKKHQDSVLSLLKFASGSVALAFVVNS